MARLVVESIGADACFVHVVDHEVGELVLMGATPDDFHRLAGTIQLGMGEGLAGWVAEHGEAAVVDDKWNDARYRYIPELRGEQYSALASIPLLRPPGTVVGVMNVHAAKRHHFDTDTVAQLEDVAGLLAGSVEAAVLLDRLQRRESELESFAARTVELQELDRRRIAGDIHDGISQRLVSAWYHLRAAMAAADGNDVLGRELSTAADLLSEALEDSRRAITGLRPTLLDDIGLAAAITSVASDLRDIDVSVDIDDCRLAPHVETAIFRITQEALQNVVKHSEATSASVRLGVEGDKVVLRVQDNGVGLSDNDGDGLTRFGLSGMHERALLLGGALNIRSDDGQGTAVVLTLPRPSSSAS